MRGSIPALLKKIERSIDCNSVDPSVKTGVSLERLDRSPTSNKRILGQIVSIFMIGCHVIKCGVDPLLVAFVSEKTPRRETVLNELQSRLNAAIQKLSEEHRMVVIMHDVQGMPHEEIGKILNCNPGTVRSRLFYARQQLQSWLSDLIK